MSPDYIEAISGLWLLALILLFTVFIVLFRRQIRAVLERFTHMQVQRGDTTLSMSQTPLPLEEEQEQEQQAQAIEPATSDQEEALEPSKEVSDAEPTTSKGWINEMLRTHFSNDAQGLDAAYKRAQEAESEATAKLRIEALYLRLRYAQGDTSAFEKLRRLADQAKDSPDVLPAIYNHIGWAYEQGDDFRKAYEAYETAAKATQKAEKRADYTVSAARCLFAAGEQMAAFGRLTDEISESNNGEVLSTLYEGLAALYYSEDNLELRAIALEKAIECNPNDTGLRFNAAYSHSESDLPSLTLMHYKTLLDFQPDHSMALNNVGVTYGELDMPIQQVAHYKKASEKGETLPSANLAYGYMNAGFADEATKVLNQAKLKEDVHPNVGSALSALAQKKEAESKRELNVLDAARKQRRFLLTFADAYFKKPSSAREFAGSWRFSNGVEATITRNANKLEIKWTQGDKEHVVAASVRNCGAKITKYERRDQYFGTSLGDKGYAYLSEDGQQIEIMTIKDKKHSFLTLERNQE